MATKLNTDRFNLSTKFLVTLVFKDNLIGTLAECGLVNVYLDDYGHKCRYKNCLLFLFNTNNRYYTDLEKNITNFKAFCDWYDVDDSGLRMLVFKIGQPYRFDLYNLKHMNYTWFSPEFKRVTKLHDHLDIQLDYQKEIYRYNL